MGVLAPPTGDEPAPSATPGGGAGGGNVYTGNLDTAGEIFLLSSVSESNSPPSRIGFRTTASAALCSGTGRGDDTADTRGDTDADADAEDAFDATDALLTGGGTPARGEVDDESEALVL